MSIGLLFGSAAGFILEALQDKPQRGRDTQTMTKQAKALKSAGEDAEHVFEPMKGSGVPGTLLASSVERFLRISLTDNSTLPVTPKGGVQLVGTTVKAEARRIADKLAVATGPVRVAA